MYFNNEEEKEKCLKVLSELDQNKLKEKLNMSYPEGVNEIAQLLTFLPEEARISTVNAFVGFMLLQ